MRKFLSVVGLLVVLSSGLMAQQKYFGSAYWSIATPTGEFRNFVNETSVSGFGVDFQWWTSDHFSAGLVLGYNLWSDVYRGVTQQFAYNDLKGAINGTQVHTMNSFTFMVGGRWIFGGSRDVRPYLGLAAGTITSSQTLDVSLFRFQETNWHVGVAPSLGLLVPIDYGTSLDVSGRFSYAMPSGTSLYGTTNNTLSHWSVNVGFTWGQ